VADRNFELSLLFQDGVEFVAEVVVGVDLQSGHSVCLQIFVDDLPKIFLLHIGLGGDGWWCLWEDLFALQV
jgi:hypothetical protein